MRLTPIDTPPTWKTRIVSWVSRRRLGKDTTPARVVYNRMPRAFDVSWAIMKLDGDLAIGKPLGLLVKTWVAMVNQCGFCVDIARAMAVMEHMGLEKFDALPEWRTSPHFDDRERAALAYVEEATRDKHVGDATFEALRKHFGEREIVEITVLNAAETFYNLINIPLEIEADGLCAIQQRRRQS
jgi:alkylhydroperoxidase family enzyme